MQQSRMDLNYGYTADSGNAEYYLNRLIQRAMIEPKPLHKIYEEECQRHSNISVTVTFKEFQTALQKHCMSLVPMEQQRIIQARRHELNLTKPERSRPMDFMNQQKMKRRKSDMQHQSATYQRMQQAILLEYSPQTSQGIIRNNIQFHQAPSQNIKSEEGLLAQAENPTAPPTQLIMRPPSVPRPPSLTRPPSVPVPPVEEEAPPEFIEMLSNPPNSLNQYSKYHRQMSSDPNKSSSVICKSETKDSENSSSVTSVQSTSSLAKNDDLLISDNCSPLNVRCVKCITAFVTCAVMPCGHCCLCGICGQATLSLKQVCPVCRKSISNVVGYSNLLQNIYR